MSETNINFSGEKFGGYLKVAAQNWVETESFPILFDIHNSFK